MGLSFTHTRLSPKEHAELDMLQRARLYNYNHTIGSASVVTISSIAIGISAALGGRTDPHSLITTYRVLLAFFAAATLMFSMPFFLASKRRPGAKLPRNVRLWSLGPR